MSIRIERINSEIQRAIASIISDGLKDTSFACMISVLSVDTSKDIKNATVRVSLYGTEQNRDADFKTLVDRKHLIKKELSHRMRDMRSLPELHFVLDSSIEYSDRISKLINEINTKKTDDQ